MGEDVEKDLLYIDKYRFKDLDEYLYEMIPKIRAYEKQINDGNSAIKKENKIQEKISAHWMPVSQPGGGFQMINTPPPSQKNASNI